MSDEITVRALIEEARAWIGTPVRANGAEKGVRCNCAGFAAGVAKALGLDALWSAFEPFQGHRVPEGRTSLLVALECHLERHRVTNLRPGLLLATVDIPFLDYASHHVAIVTRVAPSGQVWIIEASGRTVGEWPLTPERRLVRAFKVPGVVYPADPARGDLEARR